MKIIPADATIAELEQQVCEYEAKAERESEPNATRLQEKGKMCREWIVALKSGKWTS